MSGIRDFVALSGLSAAVWGMTVNLKVESVKWVCGSCIMQCCTEEDVLSASVTKRSQRTLKSMLYKPIKCEIRDARCEMRPALNVPNSWPVQEKCCLTSDLTNDVSSNLSVGRQIKRCHAFPLCHHNLIASSLNVFLYFQKVVLSLQSHVCSFVTKELFYTSRWFI